LISAPAIPSCFGGAALGRVAEIRLGKMLQSAPGSASDTEVPYLRAGSLADLEDERPTMWASPQDLIRYAVRAGDLLVAEGGDVGRAEFAPRLDKTTIIQNSLHRVRTTQGDIRFVRYVLANAVSSGWLDVLCNRSTFGHLTVEKLAALQVPWPDFDEQRAIADHLDLETARIDALIEKKRRLLGLLNERLRLTALQLTTNDGKLLPLRRCVTTVKTGTTPPPDALEDLQGDDVPWYSPADVGPSLEMREPARRLARRAISEGWVPRFPADSTVLVGIGATAGRVGHLRAPATGNQQMTCLVTGDRVHNLFLSWQLWSRSDELKATAPYTTLPILNNDFLRSFEVYVPPLDVQVAIASDLDSRASATSSALATMSKQLDLLAEHRQALIALAVLGDSEALHVN
jgi:type I restriction enzyme S subunit